MSAPVIAACLSRYRQHVLDQDAEVGRKRAASEPLPPLTVLSFQDLIRERSPEERVESLLQDPIRSALKGKVRDLGWHLWLRGGVDRMREVSDQVEDLCPGFSTFAGSTLDKWWDGIGSLEQPGGMWVA